MLKKILKVVIASSLAFCTLNFTGKSMLTNVQALEETQSTKEYELYPIPHSIRYTGQDFILRDNLNVVFGEGIDKETKERLKEVAALKNLNVKNGTEIEDTNKTTNVLVGIYNSGDVADEYVKADKSTLFEKLDSYYLSIDNGTIVILGKDTDAAFYGLTTLYHIFAQMDSRTILNLTIEDYADVKSRGFIEGYYGNPWSTSDRCDLMEWGGYYKLNSYFYAPKDDPKHRTQWNVLYTDDEIKNKIDPLVKAGNDSKCRFVFALHPFPHGNSFNFNDYNASLAALKAKYKQVIDRGARQIALLADDFVNPGGENEKRILNDLTAWLKGEVKREYPDMKTTIPFVPFDYMGNGSSAEFTPLKQTNPEDVQIVMTGGRIWGEVTTSFTDTFTRNTGRGPYMWINWPCSDNSHSHLIMGGYKTFLHAGVSPSNIQGIILNPMQQSKPSKVAIFGNAAYSWHIWTEAEADQAYEDSFKYVDHNSAIETGASNALKELSKHMINQNMDGRVTKLEESVELKPILNDFINKLKDGTLTDEDYARVREEFEILKDAVKVFKASGNEGLLEREQMGVFLDCWEDTLDAIFAYINGVEAAQKGDVSGLLKYNSEGKAAFDKSKGHKFLYVDYYERAEVGVQHIVPFINTLAEYCTLQAEVSMNPFGITPEEKGYKTNLVLENVGIRDLNDGQLCDGVLGKTEGTTAQKQVVEAHLHHAGGNSVLPGDYVQYNLGKYDFVTGVDFAQAYSLNGDAIHEGHLEYLDNKGKWITIEGVTINRDLHQDIDLSDKNIYTSAIRLVIDGERPIWWRLGEFKVRTLTDVPSENPEDEVTLTVELEQLGIAGGAVNNIVDGNTTTFAHLNNDYSVLANGLPSSSDNRSKDTIPVGAKVKVNFSRAMKLATIKMTQDSGDKITEGRIEYLGTDGQWHELQTFSGAGATLTVEGNGVTATAIRIENTTDKNNDNYGTRKWWKLYEIEVNEATATNPEDITKTVVANGVGIALNSSSYGPLEKIIDGDKGTYAYLNNDYTVLPDHNNGGCKDTIPVNANITIEYSDAIRVGEIKLTQDNGDKVIKGVIEYFGTDGQWHEIHSFDNAGAELVANGNGVSATKVRLVNLGDPSNDGFGTHKWWKVYEFEVEDLNLNADQIGGTTEYLYTNVEKSPILSRLEDNLYQLTRGNIELESGEYIGLEMTDIFKIEKLSYDISGLNNELSVEYSTNAIEWHRINNTNDVVNKDARYIRIVNNSNGKKALTINEFKMAYNQVSSPQFYKTNMGINAAYGTTQDMRNLKDSYKIFDGDLTTKACIGDYQIVNNGATPAYVIFDLGQERTIHNLRYYVKETEKDYIRDAIFEVSNDPDGNSWAPVLTIGDGQENDSSHMDVIAKNYDELIHDSKNPGNMYKEGIVEDDSAKGRYLRVRFTAPFRHRFPAFYEITINNNEYVSPESSRSIVSEDIEENGKLPSYMLDGDYTTSYKSSAKDSSFRYVLSKPNGIRTVRIISEGTPSQANVYATVYTKLNEGSFETEEILLGKLNQTVTEFNIPENVTMKEIKVMWEDTIPEIIEIAAYKNVEDVTEARVALKALIDQPVDLSTWTDTSKKSYEDALSIANDVYNNTYASKVSIENITGQLRMAIEKPEMKYTGTELKALLDAKVSNEEHYYTMTSYNNYLESYNIAKEAFEDKDNLSQKVADKLILQLTEKRDALKYSNYHKENAILLLEKENNLQKDAEDYTKATFDAYTNAKEALETAVEDETTTPMTFKELIEKLENKGKSLVSVVELKEVINEYETFNSELYTKVTFDGYVQAIDDGKKLLENGTTKEITDQIEAIHVKKQALVPNSDLLEDIIQDAMKVDSKNYTIDSYNKLQAAINDAQTAVENTTRDQYDVHATNITNAKTALVNITALKDMMNKVNKLDESSYTKESYQVVADMMKDTEQVIIDGNVQEVKEATTNLRQAIDKLELSGTKAWKEYVQNLKLKDSADYTVESYKEYKQAYDNLVGMNEDLSLVEFNKVKFVYEEALEALIYKTADYSKVQEILNKIPEDLSAFDAKKVEALNKIIATIDYNKKINEQKVVDQYAQNLQKALDDVLKSFNQTNKPSEDKPSIDSDVLGEEVDTTKKPTVQPKPNQPTNIKNVNGVKTGDDVMIAPYAILAMCAIGVYMTLRKRKQG
ncbi:MAG: hypothetical protein HFF36_09270 [Coprobacillus sp.]|nr:hypothetical protein [Coprobacillus sp.]